MRKPALAVALFILASTIAHSEPAKTVKLDLPTAIRLALENNPGLKAVKEGESIARARLDQAKASDSLMVRLNSGYSRLSDPTLFGGMPVVEENTNVNSLSIAKPIYTGGASEAARKQARWGIEASKEQVLATREDLTLAVVENYIRAIQAREGIRVADDAVSFLEANLSSAQKLKEAGSAPKSDVYRAETELASAREKLVHASNGYKTQLAVLRSLLALQPGTPIELPGEVGMPNLLKDVPGGGFPDDGVVRGSEEPSSERAEVRAAENMVKAAEAGIQKAKAAGRPVVEVSADYQHIGEGAEFPRVDKSFAFGVRVSVPLWDGGSARAQVNEAKASARKAQEELEAAGLMVALEKEQAALALESADAWYLATDSLINSARESLRVMKVSYEEGIAPMADILGARTAMTEAEHSRLSSMYDRYIAQVRLLKAEGTIMSLGGPQSGGSQ